MAKLTEEEAAQLKALQDKHEAPEEPDTSRSRVDHVNITIDMADETQVRRALKMGLLNRGDLDEFDDAPPPDGDEPPKDGAPTRTLDKRFS